MVSAYYIAQNELLDDYYYYYTLHTHWYLCVFACWNTPISCNLKCTKWKLLIKQALGERELGLFPVLPIAA